MQEPFSQHKIVAPSLPSAILHREALIAQLQQAIVGTASPATEGQAPYKLVLLYAPAGYGKTTLFADFAHSTQFPCCWYRLEHTDADKITFLQTVITTICARFPAASATLETLLSPLRTTPEKFACQATCEEFIQHLAAALAAEIREKFALVLSNYHEVNANEMINLIVNQMLKRFPAQCVLVIESRAIPNLEFAPLLIERKIFSLSAKQLRFSAAEIQQLSNIQGREPLGQEEAERLTASFDGWIAGILLGTHLGDVPFLCQNKLDQLQREETLSFDRHHLFAYMLNEIFQRELEIYAFLKEVAILEQMTPAFCDALLEREDSAARFQYLEQQGLFLTSRREKARTTYTCHSVLRDLLRSDLRSQNPERFHALHARASLLFAAEQDYANAVYHAFEAKSYEQAARLIIAACDCMQASGQVETLARWIDTLPSEVLSNSPQVLLLRANLHLMHGEYLQALPLLEEADRSSKTACSPDELPARQVAIVVARSKALFQTGQYEQARYLCSQILNDIPANETALRAEVHMTLGICANLTDNFSAGIDQLQRALQLVGRATQGQQTAKLHSLLASAYSLLGNFALAEHHLARALSSWEGLPDPQGKINHTIRCALVRQRQGLYAEAERMLTQAMEEARQAGNFRSSEAYALVCLGDLYQDEEKYTLSLAAVEEGLALARQLEDSYLVSNALCILALSYLFMGDASTAWLLLAETAEQETGKGAGVDRFHRAMHHFTCGTILLHRQQYEKAAAALCQAESTLREIGIKRELLQVTLRLAACRLAQGEEIGGYLQTVEELTRCTDYKQVVQVELRRHTCLEKALRTRSEGARLHAWLQIEADRPAEESPQPALAPQTDSEPEAASLPGEAGVDSSLQIHALGEPLIAIDHKPITHWRLSQIPELFFLLLENKSPMRKEQIITALWETVDEQIEKKLRMLFYYLRKTLGESCVVFQSGCYSLCLEAHFSAGVWHDVAVFQTHAARAQQALAEEDEETARREMEGAVELYRGEYLQSFYSDWCRRQREELRQLYLDMRDRLARLAWQLEQFDESRRHWQAMLVADPCLENAHLGLMRYYLRLGKRSLALRQYQQCKETLHTELGVGPGTGIQNFYQRYLAGNH